MIKHILSESIYSYQDGVCALNGATIDKISMVNHLNLAKKELDSIHIEFDSKIAHIENLTRTVDSLTKEVIELRDENRSLMSAFSKIIELIPIGVISNMLTNTIRKSTKLINEKS